MPLLWWFAETSAVAGALALLAWALGRSKRLGLGPGARHLLWLVVLVKLLTPPIVAWPDRQRPISAEPTRAVEIPAVSAPIASAAPAARDSFDDDWERFDDVPLAVRPPPLTASIEPPMEPLAVVDAVPTSPPVRDAPAVEPTPISVPNRKARALPTFNDVAPFLLGIWGLGCSWVVIHQGARIVRFSRRLRRGEPAPAWLMDDLAEVARDLGVKPPRIRVLNGLASPMLWCLGRPVLVVPEGLATRWGDDRLSGVLAHELAHLKRLDHWVARLELVAEVVWWWSPLYWFTRRKLREEAELAGDAWVVRFRPQAAQRRGYAEALVDVCEHLSTGNLSRSTSLKLGAAGSAKLLEGRLLMILRDTNPNPKAGRWALAAALLAIVSIPGWTSGPSPNPQDPPKPPSASPKPETPAVAPKQVDPPRATLPPKAETPVELDSPKAEPPPTIDPPKVEIPAALGSPSADSTQVLTLPPAVEEPKPEDDGGRPVPPPKRGFSPEVQGIYEKLKARMELLHDISGRVVVCQEMRYMTPHVGPSSEARDVQVEVAAISLGSDHRSRTDSLKSVWFPDSSTIQWNRTLSLAVPGLERKFTQREDEKGASRLDGEPKPVPHPYWAGDIDRPPFQWGARAFLGAFETGPFYNLKRLEPLMKSLRSVDYVPSVELGALEQVDGIDTVRLSIETLGATENPDRTVYWLAPALDYALVRYEIQQTPTQLHGGAMMATHHHLRVRLRDFQTSGSHQFARRIDLVDDRFDENGKVNYRLRLRATIEDVQGGKPLPDELFRPVLTTFVGPVDEELDAPSTKPLSSLSSSSFQTKIPPLPAGLVERFRKAVAESPFGPPGSTRSGLTNSSMPPNPAPSRGSYGANPPGGVFAPSPNHSALPSPAGSRPGMTTPVETRPIPSAGAAPSDPASAPASAVPAPSAIPPSGEVTEPGPSLSAPSASPRPTDRNFEPAPARPGSSDPFASPSPARGTSDPLAPPPAAIEERGTTAAPQPAAPTAVPSPRRPEPTAPAPRTPAAATPSPSPFDLDSPSPPGGVPSTRGTEPLPVAPEPSAPDASPSGRETRPPSPIDVDPLEPARGLPSPSSVPSSVSSAASVPVHRDEDESFDLDTLRDQIELLETRLPGKAAQKELADSTLTLARAKHVNARKLLEKGGISTAEVNAVEGTMLGAQADYEQKRADHQEAVLMIKQAKRKLAREELRARRALDTAREVLASLSGRPGVDPTRLSQAEQRIRRLEEVVFDAAPNEKAKTELRERLQMVKTKYERIKRMVRNPNDPSLTAAKRQIQSLEAQLKELEQKPKPPTDGAVRPPGPSGPGVDY